MGKRSRKRNDDARRAPVVLDDDPATPVPPRGRRLDVKARREEAPPAPWGDKPLGEIAVFVGLVLVVIGFVARQPVLLIVGFVFVGLSAAELAVREHFAGYRSHSSLIAAALALIAGSVLRLAGAPPIPAGIVGLVVGVAAFVALRRQFKALTGGLAFRA